MITWTDAEIRTNVKDATTKEKAIQIQKNALEAFKKLKNIHDDNEAKKQAEDIRNKDLDSKPAYAAADNCTCGCGWHRSKHTFNPCMAIDANIKANDKGEPSQDTTIVGGKSRPNTPPLNQQNLYTQIEQTSKISSLE